ncbi:MAG: DUF2294 domain-containing protein [Candidatus Methylomirabilis sp.]
MTRTKGQIEAEIRNTIIKFEMDFMGRGPSDVRAFILKDMVVVRLRDVLTPAEHQLAKNPEGATIVKRMRENLIAQARDTLGKSIGKITGTDVVGLFTDIETTSGDRVLVFTLGSDLEAALNNSPRPGRSPLASDRRHRAG